MDILMINLPFSGHTNPTLPLTEKLVTRGHTVTYINTEQFRAAIERTGARFVPYIDYPESPTEKEMKQKCFISAYKTAMSLNDSFDLLIYEMFFYPGIEIAKAKHIPCVRQFSQPAWSEETWRAASSVFRFSAKLIDKQMLPAKTAKSLGFGYCCLHDGIIGSKPDLNIVYVPESFQSKRESFGSDYIFLIPGPAVKKDSASIPYDKMSSPIVYISLGSIISNKGFCKECVRAFGNKRFSVILNTGKVAPESLGRLPGNIYAYSFVPQVEVLSHSDVFLTHCGMNSVNEALSLGVPMVAMPFVNDQITNGQRIAELGLGKRVRSFPSRGKELYQAVCDVYASAEIKKNLLKMRADIESQPGWDSVIERIESLTV